MPRTLHGLCWRRAFGAWKVVGHGVERPGMGAGALLLWRAGVVASPCHTVLWPVVWRESLGLPWRLLMGAGACSRPCG